MIQYEIAGFAHSAATVNNYLQARNAEGLLAYLFNGNDYIIYNRTNGNLYFDADGAGEADAVLFATLAGAPAITAADFFVIA